MHEHLIKLQEIQLCLRGALVFMCASCRDTEQASKSFKMMPQLIILMLWMTSNYVGFHVSLICCQHLRAAYQPLTYQAWPQQQRAQVSGVLLKPFDPWVNCTVCTVFIEIQVKIATKQLQILWPNLGQKAVLDNSLCLFQLDWDATWVEFAAS